MSELIKIYPDNPSEKQIDKIVEVLKKGGLIIYPSDTVYGLGCDIFNYKAMEKLCKIKGVKMNKSNFSIVCNNLSHLSEFTKPIQTSEFKILKRALPGPFTFVLNASRSLPKTYDHRKTIGIRVPNHPIPQMIVEKLGNPLASTSIYHEDEIKEYSTDPELIFEKYKKIVDIVIDSGYGDNHTSTVVDLSNGEIEVLREGKESIEQYL